MRLMTTRDKIVDAIITLIIWLIISISFENLLTKDGMSKIDAMYWFGAYVGYTLAIFTNRVVKRPYEDKKDTEETVIDNL